MQDKMDMASNETLEALEYLLNKFNVTIDVSKEALNTYIKNFCQKIVVYETIMAIVVLMIGIALLILSIYLFKKYKIVSSIKEYMNEDEDSAIDKVLSSVRFTLTILLLLSSIVVIICCIHNLAECIFFPEKTILDFLGKYI